MNSGTPSNWEADRVQAREEIISWLQKDSESSQLRIELEKKSREIINLLSSTLNIGETLTREPSSLKVLRALTKRDVGISQFATFTGFGGEVIKKIENGKLGSPDFIYQASQLIEIELDRALVPWLSEARQPSEEEVARSVLISADRILRRITSTELRYQHEPRQLEKLENFLKDEGFVEQKFSTLVNPLHDVRAGSYAFRMNVNGMTSEGLILKQNVDVLIKPLGVGLESLPIFMEAKSMTDEVNPNKRQKEEAQKLNNLKRMWEASSGQKVIYVLLIGGTVPRRYLQVEAGSGIDWVWEHRVSDLRLLFDWFRK